MDFYQTNPQTLRKLLAKRQTPCAQIFKQKPSDPTIQPKDQVNLPKKTTSSRKREENFSLNLNYMQKRLYSSKRLHSSILSNNDQNTQKLTPTKSVNELDNDEFDHIEKKIKVSTNQSSSRKVSFDNGSDLSTVCDNRSDGAPIIEVSDFLSSPPLSSEPSKIISITKIDEEIPLMNKISKVLKSSSKENFVLTQEEGPTKPSFIQEEPLQEKLKTKCEFRHKLKTPIRESEQERCPKCETLLRKCQIYAQENNGTCLSQKFDNIINFMCCKGHKWSVKHRNFNAGWCPDCVEEKKEEIRKKCEEERRKREEIEAESQKKLFEEARRRAMNNRKQGNSSIGEEELAYLRQADFEAENLAKKNTTIFMSQEGISKEITFQQAFQVNKVLAMPENCLEKYMMNLDIETVKSEFRRIAKIIHPDKNKHPSAGNAFQKIHKVYEAVINRFEGK